MILDRQRERRVNFLKKIIRIPALVRAAVLWDRALEHRWHQRDQEALQVLEEIEKLAKLPTEARILRALVMHCLWRNRESLNEFRACWEILQNDRSIKDVDRAYLKAFVSEVARKVELAMEEPLSFPSADLSADCVQKASNHVRRNFPLRDHPAWKEPKPKALW